MCSRPHGDVSHNYLKDGHCLVQITFVKRVNASREFLPITVILEIVEKV